MSAMKTIVPEFKPPSECESDFQLYDEKQSLVKDAQMAVERHQQITNANALAINKKMQEHLLTLRANLETMLQNCRNKYHANELTLTQKSQVKVGENAAGRKISFNFFGYPFFKNIYLNAARPNADYLYRKTHLREYFPMDHKGSTVYWTTLDKVYLINGVRHQVLNHLVLEFKTAKRNEAKRSNSTALVTTSSMEHEVNFYLKELKKKRMFELVNVIADASALKLDWFSISAKNLDGRHPPNVCEAIWNAFLHPALNRQPWTPEEDDKLLNEISAVVDQLDGTQLSSINWNTIAENMPRRSLFQCLVHFRTKLCNPNVVVGRWSAEEDALLLDTVNKYRVGNVIPWTNVVAKIPHRNKKQVYHRYIITLRPDIVRARFSVEEDCKIMSAFREFGLNFHLYKRLLPDRSTLQIRNRYNNVLKFVGKAKNWTLEDDTILMEHVARNGTSDWATCAKLLTHHTRTSCRTRHTAIMNHRKKHPDCKLEDIPRRKVKFSCDVTPDNWNEKIIEAQQETASSAANPAARKVDVLSQDYDTYLKYSYDYDMQPVRSSDDPITEHTMAVCQVLKSQMCPTDYRLLNALSDASIDVQCMEEPEFQSQTHPTVPDPPLPANWNTALLLRGVSIMCPEELSAEDRDSIRTTVKHPALDLFRQRFRSLLTNAAMNSMLDLRPQQAQDEEEFKVNLEGVDVQIAAHKSAEPRGSKRKRSSPRTYGKQKSRKT